ncbi:MAG: hypothetical protein ACKOC5_15750, partial [Chloroflexota bacterium]
MNKRTLLTNESLLYLLALLLALFLRLLNLGAAPLTENEAALALQAHRLARPVSGTAGVMANGVENAPAAAAVQPVSVLNPAYVTLTAATFALFGANEFTARLWPSLAGAALALAPFLLRRRTGRKAGLIAAFGLAADPGLVTISRQAGGPMLAVALVLLALALWLAGRPRPAGGLAGLALLAGPTAWHGLLALGLAWGLLRLLAKRSPSGTAGPASVHALPAPAMPADAPARGLTGVWQRQPPGVRQALSAGGLVFLLAGSALLQHPQGLAEGLYGLPAYLLSWAQPGETNPAALQLPLQLLIFQPFALIFSLVGLGRWLVRRKQGQRRSPGEQAAPWLWSSLAFSLLLSMLYPARTPADLAWTLVFAWGAAALALAPLLRFTRPHPISGLQAGLVVVLAALLWIWLAGSELLAPLDSANWWLVRPAIVVGILALALLTSALIALGWSWEISRDGLVWGLIAACGVYAVS